MDTYVFLEVSSVFIFEAFLTHRRRRISHCCCASCFSFIKKTSFMFEAKILVKDNFRIFLTTPVLHIPNFISACVLNVTRETFEFSKRLILVLQPSEFLSCYLSCMSVVKIGTFSAYLRHSRLRSPKLSTLILPKLCKFFFKASISMKKVPQILLNDRRI